MALKIQALQTDEKGHFIGGYSAAFALAASNPHCADTPHQLNVNCGANCPGHCTPRITNWVDSARQMKNINCMKNCAKGCSGGIHFGAHTDTLHH